MGNKRVGLFCVAALAAALTVIDCGEKSGSKVVETSAENRAAKPAASVAAISGSAENSSAAAGSNAVTAEKRTPISAKIEAYQKNDVSIDYPVVNGLTDSTQQEKLNAHLEESTLSPVEALLIDAAKDKLTVTTEVVSTGADRIVVVYRGEIQRSGDAAPVRPFCTSTVTIKTLKGLGLHDAVDADSMVNYVLGDTFELDNAGESKVNTYRAWVQSTGREALQELLEEKLAAPDLPLKKRENGKPQWPESFSYVKDGRIYFPISMPQDMGNVVVMRYNMVTKQKGEFRRERREDGAETPFSFCSTALFAEECVKIAAKERKRSGL